MIAGVLRRVRRALIRLCQRAVTPHVVDDSRAAAVAQDLLVARRLVEGEAASDHLLAWERPPVYAWLDRHGVDEEEQRRVFNLGIGMCAVVPETDAGVGLVIGRLA